MIGHPTTISLDGDDWTVYWLPSGDWERLRIWEREPDVSAERRIPASVPGHAQEALLTAGSMRDPYGGENWREWEWTSQQEWVYEKRFSLPELAPGQVARLRFEGIDDAGTIFLNGERLGYHEGQFVPWEIEVTGHLGAENHLLAIVERPSEASNRRWNSRFSYGTDFNPKLVPVGLWDSVSLLITGSVWLDDVTLHANLSIDRTEAAVSIVCGFGVRTPQQCIVRTEITQSGLPTTVVEDACTVFTDDTVLVQSTTIPRAQLWWPNGYGRQPLYEARISLLNCDERLLDQRTVTFGLRDIEAVQCDGTAPDTLPYRLRVNGRDVWIKGWNWVPLDLLYGGVSEERYEWFLRLAKAANVNLLRVWAGGLIEKEVFYRLCDRFGVMVWQDFPQLGTSEGREPPSDADYLQYIEEQSEAILARRRSHPPLVLWCGGHQLADEQCIPLGSDHPALATLQQMVTLEDPQRLWLPTSPSGPTPVAYPEGRGKMHDVHAPWLWMGLVSHPHMFDCMDAHLHSAFGVVGPANTNASIRDAETGRHGFPYLHQIEREFGPFPDDEAFRRAGQLIQAIGLQYGVEANRRRKWSCAGTLPWTFNEAHPAPLGPSAVDFHGGPKPAYYAVKRAYAPFHVSAQFPTFDWAFGEDTTFKADLWLHNSGAEKTLLNVVAVVTNLNGRELYQENLAAEAPENASEAVGDLSWRFPSSFAAPFILWLEVIDEEGDTIARNAYLHSRAPDPPFAALLSLPQTALEVEPTDGAVIIKNVGATVAIDVEVSGDDLLIEDSGFHLCPGSERRVKIDGDGTVRVSARNAAEVG